MLDVFLRGGRLIPGRKAETTVTRNLDLGGGPRTSLLGPFLFATPLARLAPLLSQKDRVASPRCRRHTSHHRGASSNRSGAPETQRSFLALCQLSMLQDPPRPSGYIATRPGSIGCNRCSRPCAHHRSRSQSAARYIANSALSRPWLALKAPAYCQKLAIHDARRIASNIAKLRELLGKV